MAKPDLQSCQESQEKKEKLAMKTLKNLCREKKQSTFMIFINYVSTLNFGRFRHIVLSFAQKAKYFHILRTKPARDSVES